MCGITACISLYGRHSLAQGRLNGHFEELSNENRNGALKDQKKVEPPEHFHREIVQQADHPESGSHSMERQRLDEKLKESIHLLQHRGPDESGTWVSQDATVGLAHCRLSIHDLSPTGSQPLTSDDGQIHAVVNGEIYDHDRLRNMCTTEHGYRFKGQSDSELLLALYKTYGAPDCFKHMRGEFAAVLYDTRIGKERFIAVRDRYGIKPLVMTLANGRLLLAAEAKAFLPLGWMPEWDISAILEGGWSADRRTIFKGVRKLLPGQWLEITQEKGIEINTYWEADYRDKTVEDTRSLEEMIEGAREQLVESVRLRMRADVPIGVYLSGGIDSSAVAGIVTKLAKEDQIQIGSEAGKTRIACFSVGFPEASGYDESAIAERTAKWLGVETITRKLDEQTLARNFADTVYHCEHHHNDLNSVAKFSLSEVPQQHGIKVVLTGEGADEHFAGYPFFPAEFLREPDLSQPKSPLAIDDELRRKMQKTLDQETRKIFTSIGLDEWSEDDVSSELNGSGIPEALVAAQSTKGIFRKDVIERYKTCDIRRTLLNSHSTEILEKIQKKWHPLHSGLYLWNKSMLPNTLLSCMGDRSEMAHGIEARTPFLDHHLTEYINNLPPSVKMRYAPLSGDGDNDHGPLWQDAGKARLSITEKWIMKEACRPFITQELYERRKHPFLAPTRWPEGGPLHRMLQGMLTEEKVLGLGFVNYETVQDNLGRAFGENADSGAFRNLLFVAAWVTLAERFGIKTLNGT